MKLSYQALQEKIKGCFNGKNIGGTLGAPFECLRQINDVDFYVQKDIESNPPPNDDLDLQIVWLNAAEKFGSEINQNILSEYWLTYIYPRWSEYGTAKANLARGFCAPISGRLENIYGESCGAFIRSEIWACLMPGHPELASVYAFYDSCVDHYGEGIYGEVFCAAAESAAFCENDLERVIEIGLSYIPNDCLVAKAVKIAQESYKSGLTYLQARERLFAEVPGTFGLQCKELCEMTETEKNAKAGCDAPNNIGIAVIGLYYGEGNFGKSMCIAVNCGEDTDCSAGFVGALLGIMFGNARIPEKWSRVLNGVINTCCIDLSEWGFFVPKTVDDFVERILAAIPSFLKTDYLAKPLITFTNDGFEADGLEKDALKCRPYQEYKRNLWRNRGERKFDINELLRLPEWCEYCESAVFKAVLHYSDAPYIQVGEHFDFELTLINNGLSRSQLWANVKVLTGRGLALVNGGNFCVPLQNTYRYEAKQKFSVVLNESHGETEDIFVQVEINGRHSFTTLRVKLIAADKRDVINE